MRTCNLKLLYTKPPTCLTELQSVSTSYSGYVPLHVQPLTQVTCVFWGEKGGRHVWTGKFTSAENTFLKTGNQFLQFSYLIRLRISPGEWLAHSSFQSVSPVPGSFLRASLCTIPFIHSQYCIHLSIVEMCMLMEGSSNPPVYNMWKHTHTHTHLTKLYVGEIFRYINEGYARHNSTNMQVQFY